MEISAKNISKKSLFKFLLKSVGYGLIAYCLLLGVLSLFGFETIAFNEQYYTGIKGLLVSLPLGFVLGLIFTCFVWLIGILGLWINSFFSGVTIVFKGVSENVEE
ncbi:hypothetical protein [Agarivorans albus]|uniref:hypothetical protein n=1 Tax=Agarivorans albus TaxID=182262 RepID=UPI0005905C66|nr:hypothetical protein [Agarivorans albus]